MSLLDSKTIELVEELGGVAAIALSHPHFHGVAAGWSAAFGGAPVLVHEADREWLPAQGRARAAPACC